MSSEIPPSPITTGFNENAWIQAPLTNAIADRNYLLKIRPDTAGVLETFTAGIKTNTINPLTSTGIVAIGNSVGNNVEIGAVTGRSTVLHIGDGNNSSGEIKIGSGDNSTGNVQILNGAYFTASVAAGNVNILNGTHDATTTGGNVNIQTQNSNGEFNVGNALSTINLNGLTTNISNLATVNAITTSYTTLPSASSQLGYRPFSAGSILTITVAPVTLNSITVGSGVWMITADCRVPNVAGTFIYSISETNNTHQNGLANLAILGTTANSQEFTINAVGATTDDPKTYYLVGNGSVLASTASASYMYATKIA